MTDPACGGGKAYGDNLNFPYGAGPGACCGFFNPSQDVANAYKTDVTGLPFIDGSWQSQTLGQRSIWCVDR